MRRVYAAAPLLSVLALAGCTTSHFSAGTALPVELPSSSSSVAPSASTSAASPSATSPSASSPGVSTAALASVFRASAASSSKAGSARVTMHVVGAGTDVSASGVTQWRGTTLADMTVSVTAAGQHITMRELIDKSAMYMKLSGAAAAGLPTPWLRMSFADLGKASGIDFTQLLSQSRQADPSKQLDILAAAGDIRVVGTETVAGQKVTHYRGTADLAKAGAASYIDKKLLAQLQQAGAGSVAYDLWLRADKLPVKMVEKETVAGQPVTTTMTFSDFGVPVTVTPPPANQVTDIGKMLGSKTA